MVHYVPVKNPSSVKLFKLKVKCWCYRDCISWRWPWLMWNMTWGKWISTQCGEIICEMLPLYQSLFVCAHVQVRVHALESAWTRARAHVCVCVRLQYACPCMIASAFMPHSAGGAGRENSLQKLLQQTGTNSWIWASAEWTGCVFVFLFNSVATIQTPQLRFP